MTATLVLFVLAGLYLLTRALFDWARFYPQLRELYRRTPLLQNPVEARCVVVALGVGLGVILPLVGWVI